MYLDPQYFTSEHAFINPDSLSCYQIEYSNLNSESPELFAYSLYALIVSRGDSVYDKMKNLFQKRYPTCNPALLQDIDQIFSISVDSKKRDQNTGYLFSPPYLVSAKAAVVSSISTEEFSKAYSKSLKSFAPDSAYPIATRYISSDGTLFIERPPFQATVDYKPAGASSKKKKLAPKTVWIPWTMYTFNPTYPGGNQFMYFSHKSLTSMSDNYYPTYLPNTYTDGRICYSNSLSTLPLNSNITPASMYAYMINEFFAGSWNSDLMNPWYYIYVSKIKHHINSSPPKKEIISRTPYLFKIFSPDVEIMKKAELDKVSKIWQYYNTLGQNTFFVDLPYEFFHYAFLSLLSTFSLEEVLALQEEVDLVHQDVATNGTQSIYYSNFHYNIASKSFKDISSTPSQYYYHTFSSSYFRGIISQVSAQNSLFPDYHSFSTKMIAVNTPSSNTPITHLSVHSRYHSAITMNDAVFTPSSTIPIYNYEDSQIYYLTPSPDVSIEQVYFEMFKTFVDNKYYFPCSSNSIYQISSKDEYVQV